MKGNGSRLKGPLESRRAVSAVIATLLLMVLAVAAGALVYAYAMGWLGSATRSPKTGYGQLQFISLYADADDDKIKIYVRNVGGIDLTLDASSIYVDGVKYANGTAITSHSLTANSVAYLEVSVTVAADTFYKVTVTATDGTTVSQSVKGE